MGEGKEDRRRYGDGKREGETGTWERRWDRIGR
jgi:hypothetical protein